MNAAACSCRHGTNAIDERESDSLTSSVSSPRDAEHVRDALGLEALDEQVGRLHRPDTTRTPSDPAPPRGDG
jgi:hypothetical protein